MRRSEACNRRKCSSLIQGALTTILGRGMNRRDLLKSATVAFAAAAWPRQAVADELPLGPLPGTRYPDPRIEALDPRFKKIGNTGIERVATGFRWCEGPVYFRD